MLGFRPIWVGLAVVLFGLAIWWLARRARRGGVTGDRLPWQGDTVGVRPPTLSRIYSASSRPELQRRALAEGSKLAAYQYYPSAQNYTEGRWGAVRWSIVLGLFLAPVLLYAYFLSTRESTARDAITSGNLEQAANNTEAWLVAIALCGVVALVAGLYMVVTKPTGTLTVIYQLHAGTGQATQSPLSGVAASPKIDERTSAAADSETAQTARERLMALDELHRDGLLRDVEYEAKRAEIIGRM